MATDSFVSGFATLAATCNAMSAVQCKWSDTDCHRQQDRTKKKHWANSLASSDSSVTGAMRDAELAKTAAAVLKLI